MLDFWKFCNGKIADRAVNSAHISEVWGLIAYFKKLIVSHSKDRLSS
jgi:hypothetical protein